MIYWQRIARADMMLRLPISPAPKFVTQTARGRTDDRSQTMQNDSTAYDPGGLLALLPLEVDGYRPEGETRAHGHDTLFELFDGEAEVYRALNVRKVVSQTYAKTGAPDVLVDVFDMGSASDAYGAYHHDMREGPSADVGRESELAGSSLFFWKHRYFVSVVAIADTPLSRTGVVGIATAMARGIDGDAELPDIARWLPEDGLIASQTHYFHTWPLLTHYCRLAGENLLELDAETEGVVARYRPIDSVGDSPVPALLLVRYPSTGRAKRAQQRFMTGFLSGSATEITRIGENDWVGVVRCDRLLVSVFDAASRDRVSTLLAAFERLRERKS